MINMLRKGIKFSIQRVYFPQSYFESRHYGKRFNSIGKFKSLTFQLRAIYFHTFAVDMSVYTDIVNNSITINIKISGVARGRGDGGGTFWGAAKLKLYLKTKIRGFRKKVVKNLGRGAKKILGVQKIF